MVLVGAWQKWAANPGGRPTRVGGQAVRYVTLLPMEIV
jgi:hypothetical protein